MIDSLIESGPALLLGTTVLLATAALGGLVTRQPIDRQRAAELAVVATLVWLPLAFVPMSRFLRLDVAVSVASERLSSPQAPAAGVPAVPDWTALYLEQLEMGRATIVAPSHLPGMPSVDLPIAGAAEREEHAALEWAALGIKALFVGAFASVAWLLVGAWQLRRILRGAHTASATVVACLPAGIRARVLVSDRPCRPFCCGVLRPTIVIPRSLCTDPALAAVLRHEAAHLRQRDPLSHLLFALAMPVLYFHPLYWWCRHRARVAAEIVADDQATHGTSKTDYARQMIDLTVQLDTARAPLAGVPIFRRPTDFTRRIEMLLDRSEPLSSCSTPARRVLRWSTTAALFVIAIGSLGVATSAQRVDLGSRIRSERDDLRAQVETLQRQVAVLREQLAANPEALVGVPMLSEIPMLNGLFSREVTVKKGDTVGKLLRVAGHPVDQGTIGKLVEANPKLLGDGNNLRVGQTIRIPLRRNLVVGSDAGQAAGLRSNVASTLTRRIARAPHGGTPDAGLTPLNLANRIIEAEGRLEMAEAKIVGAESNQIPMIDAETRMHRRKVDVLMRVARNELAALVQELHQLEGEAAQTRTLIERGAVSKREAARDRLRVRRLRTSIDLLGSVVRQANGAADSSDRSNSSDR